MIALKLALPFLAKTVDTSEAGEVALCDSNASPTFGVIASVNYKRSMFRFSLENAGALEGSISLVAGDRVLASQAVDGDTVGEIEFDAVGVQGQTRIEALLEVTTPGDAACRFSGAIDVEQPILTSSC